MLRIVAAAYAVAGIGALFLIPASVNGWLGIEADPLAGVFALLLALPWSLVLMVMESPSPMVALAACTVGIAINGWLLSRLARRHGPSREHES